VGAWTRRPLGHALRVPDPARPAREPRVEVAGIEPAEPPVFTGLRRYSPAFSGHACPGGATVDQCVPRICPRVPAASASDPTSSEAGALQALVRVAVEAATYIHLYSCGLYRCLSARPLTPPHGATRVGRRVRAVRIDQGQSRPRGRIRRRPRRGPGASRVVTTLPRKRSSTPCSTAPSRSTRTTSSAKSTRSNEDVDRITRPATTSHRRAMCPLGSSCVHIGTAACAYVYGVAGVGTD
jgi:hypothetical protein